MDRKIEKGERVYVVDESHVWEATFGSYESEKTALVIDAGGQVVTVSVESLRVGKKSSP